jgi:hypothetical protein
VVGFAEVVADEFVEECDAHDMPIGFHFVSVSRGEFELLELLKGRDDRVWAGLGCVLPFGAWFAFGLGGCRLRRHRVRLYLLNKQSAIQFVY